MITKLGINRLVWGIISVFALIAATIGVLNPSIYGNLVKPEMVFSQDVMTIVLAIIMLFWVIRIKEGEYKKHIIIIGLLAYFFYGYGIYVIERLYTVLYFLYMAIFALSFYAIVYAVINIRQEVICKVKISNVIRYIAIGFSLIIPIIFYPAWISKIIPLIQDGQKIEFTYSVFILDMCFIMPAFIILAFMTLKKRGTGLLLTPAIFIKGFTLLLSVGLADVFKPMYNLPRNVGEMWFYLIIALVFLALTIIYLSNLKLQSKC